MATAKSIRERIEDRIERIPEAGCWIWLGDISKIGYGLMSARGRTRSAHRVSWEEFRGPIPSGLCVLHTCDVRPCVNPWHMYLGTLKQNSADRDRKGRANTPIGSRQGSSKLTEDDVRQIFALRESGMRVVVLADKFCIHPNHVYVILRRAQWAHVQL